jgi:hypothetical protein
MLGAVLAQYVPETQLRPKSIWSYLIALGGVAAIYVHYTQIMDLELNLPLQYASIVIVAITLILFVKAQLNNSPRSSA